VTTEERVIAQVAEANPIPQSASPTAPERAEAERVLRRVLDQAPGQGLRRRGRPGVGVLVPVASLLVVLVVAAVILRTGGSTTTAGSVTSGGLSITLDALPSPQVPRITAGAMSREVALIRHRLLSLGHRFTVSQAGAASIVVTGPKVPAAVRARVVRLAGQSAQLLFYDWEANVLTPNGKTVASQLLAQDQTALRISQGGATGAGTTGAGGLPLYQAVKLAAKQPPRPLVTTESRKGPVYYLFGAPGSAACATVAKATGTRPAPGRHCLINGPASTLDDLYSGLPTGVTKSQGELVTVPQGTVVLQAANSSASHQITPNSANAQFFVLRDHVALMGSDLTRPKASTDQGGQPDVTFGFNGKGQSAFEKVTREIAHRGPNVSLGGATLNQHFAVALDNQLLTIPQIDYRTYPDGIIGGGGADVTGGFTAQSARDLATELRYGTLPLFLRVVP
jgi:SecD/SecF fusion protein